MFLLMGYLLIARNITLSKLVPNNSATENTVANRFLGKKTWMQSLKLSEKGLPTVEPFISISRL